MKPHPRRLPRLRGASARTPLAVAVVVASALGFGAMAHPAAGSGIDRLPITGTAFAAPSSLQSGARGGALQPGVSSSQILAAQQRLQALGYFLPQASGAYDDATQQAIWAFAKTAGLPPTDVIDADLLAALAVGAQPVPRTTEGRAIEVDLQRQLLLAVDDGVVVAVINASSANGDVVTTARGDEFLATTPVGRFVITNERDYIHQSIFGMGPMYRPKYFTEAIAIHGSEQVPPGPSTHGSIRISQPAMDWLWDTWGAPIGTVVWVY